MAEQFLHGIEIIEIDNGIRPISTVRSSVIQVFGTAPDADEDAFPLNEPVLLLSQPRKAALLGAAGTLKDAIDGIYDQDSAAVIVTRIEEGEDLFETWSNMLGSLPTKTGVWNALQSRAKVGLAPKLLCAPGFTGQRVADAVTQITVSDGKSGFGTTPPQVWVYPANATRAVAAPVAAVSNVGNGALTLAGTPYGPNLIPGLAGYVVEITATAVNGGTFKITDPTGKVLITNGAVGVAVSTGPVRFTLADGATDFAVGDKWTLMASVTGGDGANATARAVLTGGVVTNILVEKAGWAYEEGVLIAVAGGVLATGVTGDASNPVVAELQGVADRLRAIIIKDGPNSTDEAAVEDRDDWGSKRIYIIDPHSLVWNQAQDTPISQPSSARVCGVISRMDRTKGFWWSPSNQIINGIIGTARPIDFNISDPNSQANYLNEHEVATIIRHDGWRLWGNRTTASDPLWAFLPVRRTADMVYESIEAAFLWALDRPLTTNNILEIPESVNAYLRHLKAVGAIVGGQSWLDPEVNTPAQLQAGKLTISFDIEPPAPLEKLTFHAHRNGDYYQEVIDRVVRELTQ